MGFGFGFGFSFGFRFGSRFGFRFGFSFGFGFGFSAPFTFAVVGVITYICCWLPLVGFVDFVGFIFGFGSGLVVGFMFRVGFGCGFAFGFSPRPMKCASFSRLRSWFERFRPSGLAVGVDFRPFASVASFLVFRSSVPGSGYKYRFDFGARFVVAPGRSRRPRVGCPRRSR